LKAISPMVLSSVEREMRLRLAQPLNASLAIVFTVSGILMDARELQPENAAMFGNICTEEYYESALDYMKEKIEDPHFFIFSDDTAYVREHYQWEEYTIVDINHGDDSFYDMYLMSRCEGNICANSTFSFWGARLNGRTDKIMIRPTIQKNSQVFDEVQMKDLWKDWVFIDPQGKQYP